jgi:hypothetical protein
MTKVSNCWLAPFDQTPLRWESEHCAWLFQAAYHWCTDCRRRLPATPFLKGRLGIRPGPLRPEPQPASSRSCKVGSAPWPTEVSASPPSLAACPSAPGPPRSSLGKNMSFQYDCQKVSEDLLSPPFCLIYLSQRGPGMGRLSQKETQGTMCEGMVRYYPRFSFFYFEFGPPNIF